MNRPGILGASVKPRPVHFVHDEGYYDEHDIELRLSCPVQALDTKNRNVVLASGEHLGYDSVLLATGAAPR